MQDENKHTYDNGFHPKEVTLKENYNFYNRHFWFSLLQLLTKIFTRFWLLFPKFWLGYKVIGKKNKRKLHGSILICNHVHPLDAMMMLSSIHFKRCYVTTLQSNMGFGFISRYLRFGGAVPIPANRRMLSKFKDATLEALQKKSNILFYPEAALMPYCDHIRPFMTGAFHYAVLANAPIIPCCWTFHRPKGLYRLWRRNKPVMHLNILEPYTIPQSENRNETIHQVTEEVETIIRNYFIAHSDYFYDHGKKIDEAH